MESILHILPKDIINHILYYVALNSDNDPIRLNVLSTVCHDFNNILKNSLLWEIAYKKYNKNMLYITNNDISYKDILRLSYENNCMYCKSNKKKLKIYLEFKIRCCKNCFKIMTVTFNNINIFYKIQYNQLINITKMREKNIIYFLKSDICEIIPDYKIQYLAYQNFLKDGDREKFNNICKEIHKKF